MYFKSQIPRSIGSQHGRRGVEGATNQHRHESLAGVKHHNDGINFGRFPGIAKSTVSSPALWEQFAGIPQQQPTTHRLTGRSRPTNLIHFSGKPPITACPSVPTAFKSKLKLPANVVFNLASKSSRPTGHDNRDPHHAWRRALQGQQSCIGSWPPDMAETFITPGRGAQAWSIHLFQAFRQDSGRIRYRQVDKTHSAAR